MYQAGETILRCPAAPAEMTSMMTKRVRINLFAS